MGSSVSRENMIFFMKEYHPYYRKQSLSYLKNINCFTVLLLSFYDKGSIGLRKSLS